MSRTHQISTSPTWDRVHVAVIAAFAEDPNAAARGCVDAVSVNLVAFLRAAARAAQPLATTGRR